MYLYYSERDPPTFGQIPTILWLMYPLHPVLAQSQIAHNGCLDPDSLLMIPTQYANHIPENISPHCTDIRRIFVAQKKLEQNSHHRLPSPVRLR